MGVLEQKVALIHEKLQVLLKQNSLLQKENLRLSDQLDKAHTAISTQQSSVEALQQQAQILKYSTVEMSDTEKKEFEKKLTGYIKEIDRCIHLLSK